MDALNRTARPGSLRRWGLLVLLAAAGSGLAIVLSRGLWPWQAAPAPPFVADALDDYAPEDTVAVLRVDVDAVRQTPAGRKRLEPLLQAAVGEARQRFGWIDLLGARLPDEMHWLQLSVGRSGLEQPLWLAGGRWDAGRFQVGPGKLQQEREQGFPVCTFHDPRSNQVTTLAPAGPTLVASADREEVITCLRQAVEPGPVRLQDATLAELWLQGKRKQTLWLAADLPALQLSAHVQGGLLKRLLPRIRQARSVEGGLVCGDDVQAELHFQAADEDDARLLEREMQDVCAAAPLLRLFKMDRRLLPLVDLLAAGKTSRQGTVVTLTSRLPAE